MLNRGGPISKLVSGTIGLAKEYKADSKQRKAAAEAAEQQQQQQQQQAFISGQTCAPQTNPSGHQDYQRHHAHDDYYDSDYSDEEHILDWDEAQQELSGTQQQTGPQDVDRLLQTFAQRHPPPAGGSRGLSSFVLLPQRRVKSQHKGFVRAYAPELEQCGIDQDAWLEFLDGFEKAIGGSTWFHVANAGVFFTGTAAMMTMGISPVLHMASMAIHVSVEAGRRGYLNHQQNRYLDVMNEQFFKPRGLYCMIVKYEPSSTDVIQNVDLERNVTQSVGARQDQSAWKGLFSSSSMKIQGGVEMPEPAALVFPERQPQAGGESSSNAFKNFGRVMNDYKDRRAAAKFEAENPNSGMPSAPRKEFASVYGDPNSAANKGGFISLASKGTKTSLGPSGGLADKLSARREARQARRKQKKEKRPMSKMLRSDALYLMVTNLPSQEIMDSVAAQMRSMEAGSY